MHKVKNIAPTKMHNNVLFTPTLTVHDFYNTEYMHLTSLPEILINKLLDMDIAKLSQLFLN